MTADRRGPQVANDVATVVTWLTRSGWTDGLPVWPPLRAVVESLVDASGRGARDVVARLPPSFDEATVELVAANAAMAGCPPPAMPVVLAAVAAVAEPPFNLMGVQATTHPCGVLVLGWGPASARAGITGGEGCLGPGAGSNLAVGRALRLTLSNVGGARPGSTDRATHGTPAKVGACFAETAAASPWPPLQVEEGWAPDADASGVTVLAAEGPHNVQDHRSATAAGVLDTVGIALRNVGANNFIMSLNALESGQPASWRPRPLVVLGPEHAWAIADGGHDRASVRQELWERSHVRIGDVPREWRTHLGTAAVPLCPAPADILVAVAGGPGRHSCWFPSMGSTNVVARAL